MDLGSQLSRRERQIMDIIFVRGEATGAEVRDELPKTPSRGAMRTMLRILEEKGHLTHTKKDRMFLYHPTQSKQRVGPPAFQRVVDTFFGGSLQNAVAAHLAERNTDISDEELKRLAELIRKARNKGK
jgi:BlaI family penicillinase repressor